MVNEDIYFYQKVARLNIVIERAYLERMNIVNGYESLVIFDRGGYRCGYIGLRTDIPKYNLIKENLREIKAHGSTVCCLNAEFDDVVDADVPRLWVGYDCNHRFDGKDYEALEKYFGKQVRDEQENIDNYFNSNLYGDIGIPNAEVVTLQSCELINRSMIYDIDKMLTKICGKSYQKIIEEALKAKTIQMER